MIIHKINFREDSVIISKFTGTFQFSIAMLWWNLKASYTDESDDWPRSRLGRN